MRPLLFTLFAASQVIGCSGPSERWDAIDWTVEEAARGAYSGSLHFEVKAKAGPVVVQSQTCERYAWLRLDAEQVASGTLWCDFGGDIGVLSVSLDGAVVSLPLIEGTLSADVDGEPFETTWSGGFTSQDSFFGETSGSTTAKGLHILFEGWFEVSRVDPAAAP